MDYLNLFQRKEFCLKFARRVGVPDALFKPKRKIKKIMTEKISYIFQIEIFFFLVCYGC